MTIKIDWELYTKAQQEAIKSIFENDGIEYDENEYRCSMIYAIEMGKWCKMSYQPTEMLYSRYCWHYGVDISNFIELGLEQRTLRTVFEVLRAGLDTYEVMNFLTYNSSKYTSCQIKELLYGMLIGMNIKIMENEEYSANEMKDIRKSFELKNGVEAETIIKLARTL